MTLQGTKNDGTDMHSMVANLVGISRNEAKVLNYGRIYGAGKAFAARFLRQSNPTLSDKEAKLKAETIYKQTKGSRRVMQSRANTFPFAQSNQNEPIFQEDASTSAQQVVIANVSTPTSSSSRDERVWIGGSESHMFNQLEAIALSTQPRTPVLNCLISTSLLNEDIRRSFLTSIVNWVVQSSAVDYLHLMLVSMRHLMDHYSVDGRFSISIHDEVRYLIKEPDQHRAALALQVSNLLTRAMFASRVEMYDLPQSVAFFSSVDFDTVLRKEVNMDCKTPSNPHGLRKGYGVPFGESLDIYKLLKVSGIKEIAQFSKEEKKALSK
jgi:DNA polymerase gamma 1